MSKKWLKIAYEAADAVIESKTFELFKPSDLVIEGDEGAAYRYLFILENEKLQELTEKVDFSIWEKQDKEHTVVRFATSWSTKEADIEYLSTLL